MTVNVAITTNTNSFEYWLNRTNELANAMTNLVVTVNSNTALGNAAVSNRFSANLFSANISYFVGNSTANAILTPLTFTIGNTSANLTISSNVLSLSNTSKISVGDSSTNVVVDYNSIKLSNTTSNVSITVPNTAARSGNYYLKADGVWTQIGTSPVLSSEVTITTAGIKTVDTFLLSSYRAAEYLVHVRDNSANNRVITKLLIGHDGAATATPYVTEYGTIVTNTNIGYFSVVTTTTELVLSFTPSIASANVRFTRTVA
jgi:hypothetical protein